MTEIDMSALHDCRDIWAKTLSELAAEDNRIIAVVNDSIGSSKLGDFAKAHPQQTINVGIAEQNMVGVAAGLANGGKVPFVSAAGCFLTARAMEQIKVDIAYSNHNVKLIAQSPGVAYGELGPTHHSIEDFTWMRALPGMTVLAPADPLETRQVIRWAAESDRPVYIRIARTPTPDIYPEDYRFEPGKAVTMRDGTDVTIIGTGLTVAQAILAADSLAAEGISARVLSMPSIKPLDEAAILAAAKETSGIVTIEEGLVCGLGGAVSEFLAENCPTKIRRLGFQDAFALTGSTSWLFERQRISASGISASVHELLGK